MCYRYGAKQKKSVCVRIARLGICGNRDAVSPARTILCYAWYAPKRRVYNTRLGRQTEMKTFIQFRTHYAYVYIYIVINIELFRDYIM